MLKFLKDQRGNVALTFGLTMIPLIVMAGGAVDMTVAYTERQRAQDALDRATLAAGKDIGLVAASTIQANLPLLFNDFYQPPAGTRASNLTVQVDGTTGTVTANVTITTDNSFLPLVNVSKFDNAIQSQITMGNADFDVVMVLDTSGSMSDNGKIGTLKTAAKDLATTLLNMNVSGGRADRVQLAIVPFSTAVNIGPGFGPTYAGITRTGPGTGAAWLDIDGKASIANENWNAGLTAKRFDLFAKLAAAYPTYASKLRWYGCVEMRPYPYSVRDTPASQAVPDSLFVPMFAPDEAGSSTNSDDPTYVASDLNNYLIDKAGNCTTNASYDSDTELLEAQGRTCKYNAPTSSQFLSPKSLGNSWGPNRGCVSQPIMPLNNVSATITAKINSLVADGYTNILEGVAWGQRVLSSQAPFTEGRTSTDARPLHKVMVIMTDGMNTYEASNMDYDEPTYNVTRYGPYGYLRPSSPIPRNRLDPVPGGGSTTKRQNKLTAEACSYAKQGTDGKDKTVIYSVAFQITDTNIKNILLNCATSPDYYFDASSNAELLKAFQTIANQISRLRLSS